MPQLINWKTTEQILTIRNELSHIVNNELGESCELFRLLCKLIESIDKNLMKGG